MNGMNLHLKCQIRLENCKVEEGTTSRIGNAKSEMCSDYKFIESLAEKDFEMKKERGSLGLPIKYPSGSECDFTSMNTGAQRSEIAMNGTESWRYNSNYIPMDSQAYHTYAFTPLHCQNYALMDAQQSHHRTLFTSEPRPCSTSDTYSFMAYPNTDTYPTYHPGNRLMSSYADNTFYAGYGLNSYTSDYTDRRNSEATVGQYYPSNTNQIPFLANYDDGRTDSSRSSVYAANSSYPNQICSSDDVKVSVVNHYSPSKSSNIINENGKRAKTKSLKYRTRTDEFPFSFQIRKQERSMMKKLKELDKVDAEKSKQLMEFYQYRMAHIEQEHKTKLENIASAFSPIESASTWDAVEYHVIQIIQQVEERIQTMYDEMDYARESSVNLCCGDIRKTRLLPKRAVKILESWFQENLSNPYPSRDQTVRLALDCTLTVEQVRKWFANKRNRSRNNRIQMI